MIMYVKIWFSSCLATTVRARRPGGLLLVLGPNWYSPAVQSKSSFSKVKLNSFDLLLSPVSLSNIAKRVSFSLSSIAEIGLRSPVLHLLGQSGK